MLAVERKSNNIHTCVLQSCKQQHIRALTDQYINKIHLGECSIRVFHVYKVKPLSVLMPFLAMVSCIKKFTKWSQPFTIPSYGGLLVDIFTKH